MHFQWSESWPFARDSFWRCKGLSELRRFGAMQFVIDLVTIGFTRELGPLLTAIAVSGRSGSAFSAEIGSMVVTEEIDALRTMGIDPMEFVLAPKYLAALIVLPCLTIISNACGILAGGFFHARQHRYGAERLSRSTQRTPWCCVTS